jgi:hypothetical protein
MIKKIVKYKEYDESNLVISKSKNISKDIASSDSIFGMKSFGKMKILLDIYGDMKEQMREEARTNLDKDLDHSSYYEKSIDKLG